jgi:hypothetical protein
LCQFAILVFSCGGFFLLSMFSCDAEKRFGILIYLCTDFQLLISGKLLQLFETVYVLLESSDGSSTVLFVKIRRSEVRHNVYRKADHKKSQSGSDADRKRDNHTETNKA